MKQTQFSRLNRGSFTMIELVFVIVITGIVSVAGSKALVQIIENYTAQKEFAKLEMDSASAIRTISRYLQNSIWDSIALHASNYYNSIANISSYDQGIIDGNATRRLYFIEKNMDIINGRYETEYTSSSISKDNNNNTVPKFNTIAINSNIPYFSGFIDVEQSGIFNYAEKYGNIAANKANTANQIRLIDNSIDDITAFYDYNNIQLDQWGRIDDTTNKRFSLYFPFINVGRDISVSEKYYQSNISNNKAIFPINGYTDTLTACQKANKYLIDADGIGSSCAKMLVLASIPPQIGDVATIVNSHPSYISKKGDNLYITQTNINDMTEQKTLIAKNVSHLYLWTESSSSLIRIRLCLKNNIIKNIMHGTDENGESIGEFCKEGIIMQ